MYTSQTRANELLDSKIQLLMTPMLKNSFLRFENRSFKLFKGHFWTFKQLLCKCWAGLSQCEDVNADRISCICIVA